MKKNQTISNSHNDPMGTAIADYHRRGRAWRLRVLSPMFEEDEIPVDLLFREYDEMAPLEQTALLMARGRVLDVGAAAGCHSLALQDMGKDVTAIDISALSVEVMRQRGVDNALVQDFYDEAFTGQFDTILLLMNGAGIVGTVDNMARFFARLAQLLSPEGCVLIDSSDLRYVFEDENGNFDSSECDSYYGEVDYQMQYKNIKGSPFTWLYVDFDTLHRHAEKNGFSATLVRQGEHYDYLAMLTRNTH